MVVILKPGTPQNDVRKMVAFFETKSFKVGVTVGVDCTILGLVGDTTALDIHKIEQFDVVERVTRISEPYKKANRKFHPEDTVVDVSGVPVGGGSFAVMAGPCSIESGEQITAIARDVQASGAAILRGGAFKPRSSPYSFQGMGLPGLKLMLEAKAETGLPIVTELVSPEYCEIFDEKVDLVQIGARNMQNFELLKEAGKMSKPILLKRGLSATYEEWLMSAEYIMNEGNQNVILCERGIRTTETYTRNTLDVSAIPCIKRMSHLPVIIDPSHSGGYSYLVEPLTLAGIAAGADGIIVEVHNDPLHAKCDGQQSLTPEQFGELMGKAEKLVDFMGKTIVK
ncbi:MAG: 3-deoxy-7-phosphoheptulonate synthase [Clostridiales bacterium]|nr:3-deoxy-7-phosphoheptulonate synthase [Clostridiales bacterium]